MDNEETMRSIMNTFRATETEYFKGLWYYPKGLSWSKKIWTSEQYPEYRIIMYHCIYTTDPKKANKEIELLRGDESLHIEWYPHSKMANIGYALLEDLIKRGIIEEQ